MKQGRKALKLQSYFKDKCDIEVRCWYEPLTGPPIEMQGYAGGWFYEEIDDEYPPFSNGIPFGHNFNEAREMIDLLSSNQDLI